MRAVSLVPAAEPSRIRVQPVAESATDCTFGAVVKLLWRKKAARELVARTGCSLRTARYWMKGTVPPSGKAIAVVLAELLRRVAFGL